jgi:hypothetical protein
MTFLARSMSLDPGDSVHALLSLEAPALGAALNAMEAEDAALVVGRAPTLEERSRLVWALAPERRTEVLDRLHPGFVGALIQNREEENKRLLGDLSREQFSRLLRYCSPQQAYYWLTLATAVDDPRAKLLPLLIPVEELAAALLSVPEFETHCGEIGDYNLGGLALDQDAFQDIASATVAVFGPEGIRDQFPILEEFPVRDARLRRLMESLERGSGACQATVTVIDTEGGLEEFPIDDPRLRRLFHLIFDRDPQQYAALMTGFGPEGILKEFPIRNPSLRRIVQTILDHDPEHYLALVQAALQIGDYRENHPEEQEVVREAPILLDSLLTLDEERARAGLAPQPQEIVVAPAAPEPARRDSDRGGSMSFLTRSAASDPNDPVHALLALDDSQALAAAVNAMELEDATLAVGSASSMEDRSRLLWALTPERRTEVLDRLHPGLVGALVQNREEENKRLLGDLSREQFTRLLRYCNPSGAYYWLTLATSIEDARANLLPLLVPLRELSTALLTMPEFEDHCQRIGDFNVEDLRLDLTGFKDLAWAIVAAFGADGMLQQFPIRDPRLHRLLLTILEHDPEHYAALIHESLQLSKYGGDHEDEPEMLQEDPILLDDLLTVEEERARAGLAPPERPAERPKPADAHAIPSLPARQSAELLRAAASSLPAQRQSELSQELQLLFLQEAAYAGGSFLQADLEKAAGRVQSYVQLGLAGLSEGDAEQAAQLLGEQRLRTLMESGARQVERLRQVALRLLPWHEVLDKRQLRLLQSLEHPDMGVEPETNRPVLRLPAAKRGAAPEAMDLEAVRTELEGVADWISLVRAVGKARIARRMESKEVTAPELTRSLAVAAILYRHWDSALVEATDLDRFRQTYWDPDAARFNPTAFRALAEALRTLAAERNLNAADLQGTARLLARAMDELSAGSGDDGRETEGASSSG